MVGLYRLKSEGSIYNKTSIKMKNLLIITGILGLSTVNVLGQNDGSRNYKLPLQNRQFVKNQPIAINKKNVKFTSFFEAPQNYKHYSFNNVHSNQELLVLKNKNEKTPFEFNPLESNRNYKTLSLAKAVENESNSDSSKIARK